MAIGKPRGKREMLPVFVYDPVVRRKRYVGSFPTLEEARAAESEFHAAFTGNGETELRRCPGCRKYFRPVDEWQRRCSARCEANIKQRERRRQSRRDDDHWLYSAYDANGVLLYVGITSTGLRRHREHGREQAWWPEVARIDVEHFATRAEVLKAESERIASLQPPYNTLGKPARSDQLG